MFIIGVFMFIPIFTSIYL